MSDLPFAALSFPVLPLVVFAAELTVVTLGTLRIIFVAKGMKVLAPLLGFFEVAIWLFAIGQIMQNLSDWGCYAAFAAGFTVGNLLGVLIEKRLALGTVLVRVITGRAAGPLIGDLKAAGYGVTRLDAEGATGPVEVVLTVIKRRELGNAVAIIKRFDRRAFYSVDDIQSAASGVFPEERRRPRGVVPAAPRALRPAA